MTSVALQHQPLFLATGSLNKLVSILQHIVSSLNSFHVSEALRVSHTT